MRITVMVLSALIFAAPVHAAAATGSGTWTVGPNLGFSVLSASGGGGSLVSIGWPSSSSLFFGGIQPGMRVGYVTTSGGSDIYLDTGMNYASSEGTSFSSIINTINYQLNFSSALDTTPFVDAGAGFALFGFDGDSETRALFGLGLGVRRKVSDGHGAVRSELRYDHLFESNSGSGLNSFAVKIGVDLWIP